MQFIYMAKIRSLPSKETLRGHSDSSFRGEGYIQCCVGVRLCDMYSNQELAEIHFMYGKADGNAALARRLYQERYPQRQCPDRKTFVRLHYRLCEYGKFNSPGLGRGRPRSTTPEVQEEILEAVNMTPSISTRRVALQALSPADYPARVRFCQWFLQQCGVNPNFPALVLFTYEVQFTRDGITNFHSQHVWAYENHVQLFHLITRLTGQAYTNFLENTIPHVLEDTPLINRRQHIHFLHDGAPAHFSRTARRYLDRRFPDRWIGSSGPIAWPPRSPDLNPLDFYLWGHLKSLVYSSLVPDLESLRNRIVACSEDIRNTPGVWDRVRRSMRHRCEVCIQAGGGILNIFCNDNDLRKEKRSVEFDVCDETGQMKNLNSLAPSINCYEAGILNPRSTYIVVILERDESGTLLKAQPMLNKNSRQYSEIMLRVRRELLPSSKLLRKSGRSSDKIAGKVGWFDGFIILPNIQSLLA
ncbi:hypothetical protein ANN_15899 [Periplaneta americana]|uniref:DUF4817 domain-containing protein n=1 Tax=Periplaneta americana TaxID=6978 RepID=A0ABQ8SHI3_PERAM|nr:hypothetical protein ANN_15899 [Periplaneta americana]